MFLRFAVTWRLRSALCLFISVAFAHHNPTVHGTDLFCLHLLRANLLEVSGRHARKGLGELPACVSMRTRTWALTLTLHYNVVTFLAACFHPLRYLLLSFLSCLVPHSGHLVSIFVYDSSVMNSLNLLHFMMHYVFSFVLRACAITLLLLSWKVVYVTFVLVWRRLIRH
jgi:hypothetical protein